MKGKGPEATNMPYSTYRHYTTVKNLLRSALHRLFLKLLTDDDFTIASERLFQTSTILQVKKYFQT